MTPLARQADARILSREECDALARRLLEMVDTPSAGVSFQSGAASSLSFVRGRAHVASENEVASVTLLINFDGHRGVASTNRLDDTGLADLVTAAQSAAREHRTAIPARFLAAETYPKGPQIYFDAVAEAMAPEPQAAIIRAATEATVAAGLIGAGDLRLSERSRAAMNTAGLWVYERSTFSEFSLTARTLDGTGSGWAWGGYEDWARVDVDEIIRRAVALGRRSANPVAVEPGRYPVILEPAAVASMIAPILYFWGAEAADRGGTVFSGEARGTNKIGEQMLDRRLGMVSDPWDPERPASTITDSWTPIPEPVVWFENGVLKNLEYDREYVEITGGDPVIDPGGVRLTVEGPTQTLDEMVASTRRGIWVNRFSNVLLMNRRTLLLTGTTRDGTFLIENGKITKAIKNFRFTESPFFVLNRLEASSEPVRASRQVVAPRLKLGDFNFTSLTDAI